MRIAALIAIAAIAAIALPAAARRQRTGPARITAETAAPESVADTIIPREGEIRLSGYDKPNSASVETFFISNFMPDSVEIDAANITLTYLTLDGRMLHEATHTVSVTVPPGLTRSAHVATWDRNRSFHYYRSQAPSRRQSTPFKVQSRVNYVIIPR